MALVPLRPSYRVCHTTSRFDLACYPVVERDGALYAEIPDFPPARSWAEILRAHARGEDGGQDGGQDGPTR